MNEIDHLTPQRRPKAKRSYQDFDGTGSSMSHGKLAALKLPALAGKSVLDIGCNEGFFCIEAVKQKAARVVGVDCSRSAIESARQRCPEATFIHSSWWELPAERFDVILFLSAIHYEAEQKKLLDRLRDHLAPGGVLVLECGVVSDKYNLVRWGTAKRHDGVWRYPTKELLKRELLSGYTVHMVGPSVDQAGDPVSRYVFHCKTPQGTAILVTGRGGDGKTHLAEALSALGLPVYPTDRLLRRLYLDPLYEWRPLAQAIRAMFPFERRNWAAASERIAPDAELVNELCDLIVAETPVDDKPFIIEGELMRHEAVLEQLKTRFERQGVRVWVMTRADRLVGIT